MEINKKWADSRSKIGRTGLLKLVCEARGDQGSRYLPWMTGYRVTFTSIGDSEGCRYMDREGHEFSLAMLSLKCDWDI